MTTPIRWRSPEILPIAVDHITVDRGECFTVYLNTAKPPERNAVQVELRVGEDGMVEMFCDDLQALPFSKRYA
jgi:hypothetical protein